MSVALIMALISLALSIVLFFYFRIYMRVQRKKAAEELLAEYRLEVQGLIADINLATDRDSLLVEERIKTLKQLLDDTEKRIAVYVSELERSRSGEALYSKLGQDFRHAPPVAASLAAPLAASLIDEQLVSSTESAAVIAPPETAMPKAAVSEAAMPPAPGQGEAAPHSDSAPLEKQDLRMRIAELAIQGNNAADIASKLKISVSEVELALHLLRKWA